MSGGKRKEYFDMGEGRKEGKEVVFWYGCREGGRGSTFMRVEGEGEKGWFDRVVEGDLIW